MSEANESGEVRSIVDGHILHITVDRATKLNGFTPEMFDALSTALTQLDEDAQLWVGVSTSPKHTTAGWICRGSQYRFSDWRRGR
jgi:enoyl-CoA hydratase/carnithine racemase